MSGGSYDYLCYKDIDALVESNYRLEEMADDLAELGYASDAAKETMGILLDIRAFKNRMEVKLERLGGVWRAMEWWSSCDTSEEGFKKALAEYRGETVKT